MKRALPGAIGAATAAAALLDFATSAELIGSILFTFPLVLCAASRSRTLLWGTTILAALLTIAAALFGIDRAPHAITLVALANRSLVITGLVTIAVLVHMWMRRAELIELDAEKIQSQRKGLAAQNAQLEDLMRAAIVDLAERKRSEVALKASNKELEAFSYSVAHDLRAPLRGMNGFAQLLLDDYGDKLDADARDWLQEILLNASKMGSLIDALLALARLTRSELRRESVDLSAVARAAAGRLESADPSRTVEVFIQDDLRADLDPLLAQVLADNLLGNAWKFTGKQAAARIELGADEVGGERRFFVRDNGAGFDMAFADKLFGPFQRLHTVAEFPGTGVGLATVQRIVQRHGGRVWAEGSVGGGATFWFTVPSSSSPASSASNAPSVLEVVEAA